MGCIGVLFSLNAQQVADLRTVSRKDIPDYIVDTLEEDFFENRLEDLAELVKSWDAIHRALTGGKLLFGGSRPLSGVILGGEVLYGCFEGEEDYIAVLKHPDKVRQTLAAMEKITEDAFRKRYFAIPEAEYGFPLSEEDFQYTWYYFQKILPLWRRSAEQGRYVLFTADQ